MNTLKKMVALQQAQIQKLMVFSKTVYLSDLPFLLAIPATGNGSPQRDKVYWRSESGFKMKDTGSYVKGIGLHPIGGLSVFEVTIPTGALIFHTILADIDACGGDFKFTIKAKKENNQPFITLLDEQKHTSEKIVEFDVSAYKILRFETDTLGNDYCDHASFVDAKFIF